MREKWHGWFWFTLYSLVSNVQGVKCYETFNNFSWSTDLQLALWGPYMLGPLATAYVAAMTVLCSTSFVSFPCKVFKANAYHFSPLFTLHKLQGLDCACRWTQPWCLASGYVEVSTNGHNLIHLGNCIPNCSTTSIAVAIPAQHLASAMPSKLKRRY